MSQRGHRLRWGKVNDFLVVTKEAVNYRVFYIFTGNDNEIDIGFLPFVGNPHCLIRLECNVLVPVIICCIANQVMPFGSGIKVQL